MAKGDKGKSQDMINSQGPIAQGALNHVQRRNDQQYDSLYNNYNNAVSGDNEVFNDARNNYNNFMNRERVSVDPKYRADIDSSIEGYKNFAATGGFSDQDIQNLRARGVAPTRSIYAGAQRNIDRARAVNGGGANYAAASAKAGREMSHAISDANINTNASIAERVQQGKLAGLAGQGDLAGKQEGLISQLGLANQGLDLEANRGLTSLYGTTPGRSSMFGNQMLNSSGQGLGAAGLQNALSLGLINAQQNQSKVGGGFMNTLGNITGIGGALANGWGGWKSLLGLAPSGGGQDPANMSMDPWYGYYGPAQPDKPTDGGGR